MDGDTETARRAAAGDMPAFTVLVRRHQAPVRRFLHRLSPQDADDIAQDVFIKAWRMRAGWREQGPYGAWLMRIAWTSFLSHYRRSDRYRPRQGDGGLPAEASAWPSAEGSIDLARALAGLDPKARAAAELCFAQGYSHGEAADILALPLGTVKSIVARARVQLAAALENTNDG
jgi:RNA polymerase sigma-70 factor (ECF subfamily)